MPRTAGGRVSLRKPPTDPRGLEGFPSRRLSPEIRLFRVVRRGRGPWWFGSTMQGRFDLAEPQGTCYLATDEISALLEVIGPDLLRGTISSEFLANRSLRQLRLPEEREVADLTSREAVRFGVTAEIGTLAPYELPQAWATALCSFGHSGIAYWPRHDPAREIAVALFGPHGERKRWKKGREVSIARDLIRRLRRECGIEVLDIPRSDEIRLLGDG